MKFLCLHCDEVMRFAERQIPGDGTLAAVFTCGACGREVAMLTNPMETQLVSSLGVKIGGREVPAQPMELIRSSLQDGRDDAFLEASSGSPRREDEPESTTDEPGGFRAGRVIWSPGAQERLGRVPQFVRGMVKRIYTDWARQHRVGEITPDVMDRARSELGLEEM